MKKYFLFPSDISYTNKNGTYFIYTQNKKYQLRGTGIKQLLEDILPRFDGQKEFEEVISPDLREEFFSFIPNLIHMGLLFQLRDTTFDLIKTRKDVELYTYFARNFHNPDELFYKIKNQPIWIASDGKLHEPLLKILKDQGWGNVSTMNLSLICKKTIDESRDPPVLISFHEYENNTFSLDSINQYTQRQEICWIPVLFEPNSVSIGPWIYPAKTACYRCYNEEIAKKNLELTTEAYPMKSQGNPLQISFSYWISGMLSYYLMSTIFKMSDFTLWGKVIKIDLEKTEITVKKVWRQPLCPSCRREHPPIQRWMEV